MHFYYGADFYDDRSMLKSPKNRNEIDVQNKEKNLFELRTRSEIILKILDWLGLTVFWCFQGVEKGSIRNEWVKIALKSLTPT